MYQQTKHNPWQWLRWLPLASAAGIVLAMAACDGSSSSSVSGGTADNPATGTGGSTARMTLSGDYLYAIAGDTVQLFDVSTPSSPSAWTRVTVAWDIETLFPYGDYLLIGAATGMHVMDNTDPASPQYLSRFTHARARDPVVAHEGYAYVTLKAQEGADGPNQMDVIDIRDISQPRAVHTVAMQGPSGLTVGAEQLYVCDGIAGLKIFDLSDRAFPSVSGWIRDIDCNDAIAHEGILYVITDNRLLQYDYTVDPPILLSEILQQPQDS